MPQHSWDDTKDFSKKALKHPSGAKQRERQGKLEASEAISSMVNENKRNADKKMDNVINNHFDGAPPKKSHPTEKIW